VLDSIRKGSKWLTIIFIAVIGAVFVFFIGLGGPLTGDRPSAGAVVELDDIRLDNSDYQRVRAQQESRYRESLGDQFDSRVASDFLDSQSIRILVDRAIMTHAARELGLQASDDELRATVRDIPGFRDETGRFSQQAFEGFVSYEYGTQRNFLETLRRDLLAQKLARLLQSQAHVSEAEARKAALYGLEGVQIAYVALDTRQLPAGEEISDEQARAHLDANPDAVRAEYDANGLEYTEPDKVRASHILFVVEDGAEPDEVEAVRERAEAALARIREGASFDDVALELSEDPGTRETGGDLGSFARGERNAALESAFDREPGELSEVLRGDAGFHIVRTDERIEGGVVPFEDVSLEIARDLAQADAASVRARRLADELAAAVIAGQSLEDAARERDLTLERPGAIKRRPDGFVPGLGGSPELLANAFALDLETPSSSEVFEVDDKLVLIQLLARETPDDADVAQTQTATQDQLLQQKRDALFQSWIDSRRNELVESNRLLVDSTVVGG